MIYSHLTYFACLFKILTQKKKREVKVVEDYRYLGKTKEY